MTDEYATERTAFHAGATIQAYTVEGDDGSTPLAAVIGRGYWRDLSCDGEPKFSCHPTRYRVKDQHPAEAPVAWHHDAENYGNALNEAAWVFVEDCPEKSVLLFNNTKIPLRAAILKYAEVVAKTAPARVSPSVPADIAQEIREHIGGEYADAHDMLKWAQQLEACAPIVWPAMHPATLDLVIRFATALAEKLAKAEQKYGYSDGWASPEWMDECRAKLMEHIAKGDPRDVAAYCAFLWHHGASTAKTSLEVP